MAEGDYNQTNEFVKNSKEMKEMFDALASLKASLQGAVEFSDAIGKMNLNAKITNTSPATKLNNNLKR